MSVDDDRLLGEQLAYYRARAGEYDEWFFRQGRYDRGDAHRRLWFEEVAAVEGALEAAGPAGHVLELACGTGIWTRRLAARAARLTAVDASPEVLALNRARVKDPKVEYVQADIFRWIPAGAYDFVFFGFWLSHVPADRFAAFWQLVRRALSPSGTAFFVDNLAATEAVARDARVDHGGTTERRLNDGRTFRIVKVFYDPGELAERLRGMGFTAEVRATANFFIYGRTAPR